MAQDLEPRQYANTPVGMNFVLAGYTYSQGDVAADPTIPLEDAHLQMEVAPLGYARSLDLWGLSGKLQVTDSYVWLSGTALAAGQMRERVVNGLGDPSMLLSVNLYGAPALSPAQFAAYRQNVIIGASVQVTAPLGQYASDKLVNLGANRWSIRPQMGISKRAGRWTLELTAAGTFYSANGDFLDTNTLSQDPLFALQSHLIYAFKPGMWGAIDATYYAGAATTLDGVDQRNLQANTRLGATLVVPVTRTQSIKFYASRGVQTRTGVTWSVAGLAWQYAFGGGP